MWPTTSPEPESLCGNAARRGLCSLGSAVALTGRAVLDYSWANSDGRLRDKAQKALSEKFPEAKVRVHGPDAIITGLPDGVDAIGSPHSPRRPSPRGLERHRSGTRCQPPRRDRVLRSRRNRRPRSRLHRLTAWGRDAVPPFVRRRGPSGRTCGQTPPGTVQRCFAPIFGGNLSPRSPAPDSWVGSKCGSDMAAPTPLRRERPEGRRRRRQQSHFRFQRVRRRRRTTWPTPRRRSAIHGFGAPRQEQGRTWSG